MLEVISRGDGDKVDVLFVHGAWHGAWCWDDGFLERVAAAGYRCHAMSLRNHAGSRSTGGMRFRSQSEFVEDIREVASGLDNPVLVGHSMGGYLVQKYLETDTARAVGLLAPVPVGGTLKATWRFARRHPLAYLKVMGTASLGPVVSTPERAGDMLLSDPGHPLAAELCGRVEDESFRTYLQMMFLALPKPDRAETKPPMVILGGTDDRLFSIAEWQRTAEAWGGELHTLDDLPHDLMIAPGWKTVADALTDWLDHTV